MVLKKRLKKLLIIALVATTMVWFVALYLHIQGYNRYLQDVYASYVERFGEDFARWFWDQRDVSTIGQYSEYAWPNGLVLILSAFTIFVAWIFVMRARMDKKREDGKVICVF
jgi:hypothetical protein